MATAVRPGRSRLGMVDERAATDMTLQLFRDPFPQESMGAEDQNQDENGKDDGVGPPGGDVLVAPGGEKADQNPPRAAPGIFPIPPNTAAVKARSPAW